MNPPVKEQRRRILSGIPLPAPEEPGRQEADRQKGGNG